MSEAIGLRERIKAAKTDAEVKTLLNEGSTYKTASDKTKRRWNDAFRNWTAPKVKVAPVMKLAEVAAEVAKTAKAAPKAKAKK